MTVQHIFIFISVIYLCNIQCKIVDLYWYLSETFIWWSLNDKGSEIITDI